MPMPGPQPQPRASALVGAATVAAPSAATVARVIAVFFMVWFLLEIPTLANNAPDFCWLRRILANWGVCKNFILMNGTTAAAHTAVILRSRAPCAASRRMAPGACGRSFEARREERRAP